MSVRNEVLKFLEANRDAAFSGQKLANQLGVSRAAVWKAIKTLKTEGYSIEADNTNGYRLSENTDILSAEGIGLALKPSLKNIEICVMKEVDSTSEEVKRRALEGAKQGLVVLAEHQTAGKGRRGRSFYSPSGTGIYMSMLFRPTAERADSIVMITTAASVAVCRAIQKVLGEEPEIKWVNDVFLRGKKVCGILTEAVSDIESGEINTVVVGIGINYKLDQNQLSEELKGIVGAVCTDSTTIVRNKLAAEIINELYQLYENLNTRSFIEDYRKRSNVIGKDIKYIEGTEWHYGKALDIDSDGGLIVEDKDGNKRTLRTGEITLRVV